MKTATNANDLIPPYGGRLVDLLDSATPFAELKAYAGTLPSVHLSERLTCDLELLATGAFSPLDRFMGREQYQRVMEEMRLPDGHVFPIPITFPVERSRAIRLDRDVTLRSIKNDILAVMTVEEIYRWDREEFAHNVLGTGDVRHPLVAEMQRWGGLNISGRLRVLQLPRHHDFCDLRLTPAQTRARLQAYRGRSVVAFQTRNPLHRAHEEMITRAVEEKKGVLLLHPVAGMTKPGDVNHYCRMRSYKVLAEKYFDPRRTLLSLLPVAMRMAGPREALWHAVIRRNYGADYLIVGRDHASPGLNSADEPFYGPYEAQELVRRFRRQVGVGVIPFEEFVYLPDEKRYEEVSRMPPKARFWSLSGTQLRRRYLNRGRRLPSWFTRPEVAELLLEAYPPAHRRGVCIWFTGLSGAGKSTTAEVLTGLLLSHGRQVSLLDGDVVRAHLSKGLGFSKEDRDANVLRIGFVASEIVRHGGVAMCAAVSPYRATRNAARNMIGADRFVEVFVDTPLEVCEQRDEKGMYAKARAGLITEFTGVSDPYEPPENAEIVLDTTAHTPEENAWAILDHLIQRGFVRASRAERVASSSTATKGKSERPRPPVQRSMRKARRAE